MSQDDYGDEMQKERRRRALTDEDVQAIADALEKNFRDKMAKSVGNGVINWVLSKLVWLLIGALIYFYTHSNVGQ